MQITAAQAFFPPGKGFNQEKASVAGGVRWTRGPWMQWEPGL